MTVAVMESRYAELAGLEMYEEIVGSTLRYIGRNEKGRAVIGPVRHRAKGLMNLGRRTASRVPDMAGAQTAKALTQAVTVLAESFQTVDLTKLRNAFPPAPPQDPKPRKGRLRRALGAARTWCTDRWYDTDWQEGAQQTAKTTLMWSFTVFSTLVFAKGLSWILFL